MAPGAALRMDVKLIISDAALDARPDSDVTGWQWLSLVMSGIACQ